MRRNTKYEYLKTTITIITLGLLCFSGIGRDDIPMKRYSEFAQDSVFDCIGEVFDSKGKYILSCVLIDNRFLLSSAHGFYKDSKTDVIDTITVLNKRHSIKRPESTRLLDKSEFYIKFKNKKIQAKDIIIHPEYKDGFNSDGFNDIAIIELHESISFVNPAKLYTDTLEKGARGIVCGFGSNSKAIGRNSLLFSKRKKMAGENIIDSLGGNLLNNSWGVLFADMDNPKTPDCNRMGDHSPLPLEWHGDAGDCGGGLFILQNKEWRLAGISFAPSYYEDWEIYGRKYGNYGFIDGWTRVSPLVTWIKSIVQN